MATSLPAVGEIAQQGERLYERLLRGFLEPAHNGKYIVINVETGQYEMDQEHLEASDRAWARWPGARLYCKRIGAGAVGRIGGRVGTTRT